MEEKDDKETDVFVGPYKLGRKLGQGHFAKVKLGLNQWEEKVSIKIFDKDFIRRDKHYTLAHVEKELNALRVCSPHPNVATMLEVLETPTHCYCVMEYVSGGELFDYIVSEGTLDEAESSRLLYQIASAVQFCHQQGVAHRDLKPENILLDSKLNPRIVDFGLTGVVNGNQLMSTQCGSPEYAAPEVLQASKKRADGGYLGAMADVWSLGVVLYAMLCGRLPFTANSIPGVIKNILRGSIHLPTTLSSGAAHLVRRMLTVDVSQRATMEEVLAHPWLRHDQTPQSISVLDRYQRPKNSYAEKGALSPTFEGESVALDAPISLKGEKGAAESDDDYAFMNQGANNWGGGKCSSCPCHAEIGPSALPPTPSVDGKVGCLCCGGTGLREDEIAARDKEGAPAVDQEEKSKLESALFTACEKGEVETVEKLIDLGVDLRATYIDNWTALHYTARKGHVGVCEVLLTSLKPLNINAVTRAGWSPMMMAADRGHTPLVKLLLLYGADIHINSTTGKTAIILARESKQMELAQLLTQASSDRTRAMFDSNSYQFQFFTAAEQGDLVQMKHLLRVSRVHAAGAATNNTVLANERGIDNWSALHFAARKGHVAVCQALVSRMGVKPVDCRTKSNWTPLMMAADKGHVKVARLLLRYGADPRLVADDGNSAIDLAVISKHRGLAEALGATPEELKVATEKAEKVGAAMEAAAKEMEAMQKELESEPAQTKSKKGIKGIFGGKK